MHWTSACAGRLAISNIVLEAQEGGPIALLQDSDLISIDAETGQERQLNVELGTGELTQRLASWNPPPCQARRDTLYKYIKTVKTAVEEA
ncbi:MAG: dihydroxy-acid dehydratase [Gammaproteobacteria bacterium]